MTIPDLETLPKPVVIEEVAYAAIVARQIALFRSNWTIKKAENLDAGLPDYDVEMLETDPVIITTEAESYRETLLRARVNDAARANLLAFATGSDLEHLAAFYDVERMAGELDDRLKARVILAIKGRSTGGTEDRYKYVAMSADIHVTDVIVYTVGRSPVIRVAVFSDAPDGVASPTLLATVNAALQATDVRMVNDTILVETAVRTVVNLVADIWLLPDADASTVALAEQALRLAWASYQRLGRDLTSPWWTSRLMISGVYKVAPVSPIGDVITPPAEALSIGTIELRLAGRAF